MPTSDRYLVFAQMLNSFVDAKEFSRSTKFVRELETEFVRLGLDDEDQFSGFQYALAMFRGYEDDIRELNAEAVFVLRCLSSR